MEIYNNQIARENKLIKYAKKVISCAFIAGCLTSSASAMLARAAKEGFETLRPSLTTIARNNHFLSKARQNTFETLLPILTATARNHHFLSQAKQKDVVIEELSSLIPQNQMYELLQKLPSLGVDSKTISVVETLYAKKNKLPNPTVITSKESTFALSNTGC